MKVNIWFLIGMVLIFLPIGLIVADVAIQQAAIILDFVYGGGVNTLL